MPPRGVKSGKRKRQYEHIKDSARERGASNDRAEEIAARTVNKQRSEAGETRRGGRSTGGRKKKTTGGRSGASRKTTGGSRTRSTGTRKTTSRGNRKTSSRKTGSRKKK